jgi:hypothetical protein
MFISITLMWLLVNGIGALAHGGLAGLVAVSFIALVVVGIFVAIWRPPRVGLPRGQRDRDRAFCEPGTARAQEDLFHILLDGYVVVLYRVTVPGAERAALARWVGESRAVVAAPVTAEAPNELEALSARSRMTCARFDMSALERFRDDQGIG